jgi:hypothetical protein
MPFYSKEQIAEKEQNKQDVLNYCNITRHMITATAYEICKDGLIKKTSNEIIELLQTLDKEILVIEKTKYHKITKAITMDQKDLLYDLIKSESSTQKIAKRYLAFLPQKLIAQLCSAALYHNYQCQKQKLPDTSNLFGPTLLNDEHMLKQISSAFGSADFSSHINSSNHKKVLDVIGLMEEIKDSHEQSLNAFAKDTSQEKETLFSYWIARDKEYEGSTIYESLTHADATAKSVVANLSSNNLLTQSNGDNEIKRTRLTLNTYEPGQLTTKSQTKVLEETKKFLADCNKNKKQLTEYSDLVEHTKKLFLSIKQLSTYADSFKTTMVQQNAFKENEIEKTVGSLKTLKQYLVNLKTNLPQKHSQTPLLFKESYSFIHEKSTKQATMIEEQIKRVDMALLRAQLIQYARNCVKLFTENPHIAIHFMKPVFLLLDKDSIIIPPTAANEPPYCAHYNTCVKTLSRQISETFAEKDSPIENEGGISLSLKSLQNWAEKNEGNDGVKSEITKQWEKIISQDKFTKYRTNGTQRFYRDFFDNQKVETKYVKALNEENSPQKYLQLVKDEYSASTFRWELKEHVYNKAFEDKRLLMNDQTSRTTRKGMQLDETNEESLDMFSVLLPTEVVNSHCDDSLAQILGFLEEYHANFTRKHNEAIKPQNSEKIVSFFTAHKGFNDTYNAIEKPNTRNTPTNALT